MRTRIALGAVVAITLLATSAVAEPAPTAGDAAPTAARHAPSAVPAADGPGVVSPSDEARVKPRKPTITYWTVTVSMDVEPTAESASVRMLVPVSDGRQAILGRTARPSAFRFREDAEPPNLWVSWEAGSVKPQKGAIAYTYTARTTDLWIDVPRILLADNPPPPDAESLRPTETMQSDDPVLARRAASLTRDAHRIDEMVWSLYQYAASFLRSESTDAPDDARAVLAAERGSPSGRARLLVALLRASGIPARLVGGLRLEDAARKRATLSWVEAWLGGKWVPFDPSNGHYATLPANYLALYYGDLPLIEHTAKLGFRYDMLIHQVTRQALLAQEAEPPATTISRVREINVESDRVRTYAFYAEKPVASVVLITDVPVASQVIERIVADARERSISVVFLSASFESRYFREHYLQRLIANNFAAVAESHLLLVSTRDEAGLYALLQVGEQRVALRDARIVVAGGFPRAVGKVLGSVLYRLMNPGELVLVNPQAPLLSLWNMARANLIDGTPMVEAAAAWDLRPLVIDADDVRGLAGWRRGLVKAWSEAVVAQVPLQAINLILVLPVIACIVVFRSVIGIETFGTFAPVIVSLAFLMTGLTWGIAIFCVIVGLGVVLRSALQWVRIQLVARLAVLIALVSAMMAGLTVVGAYLGVGALLNVSIFPMVIMSNVIENFTTTQVELGTREAIRLTRNTLLVCSACYLTIEWGGLQSIVLSYPEILIGVVGLEIAIGKWRGLRLLEYVRFSDLGRAGDDTGSAA
jgi:transglutaminase-like putative cysteine protease